MSYSGKSPKLKRVRYVPQSSDPLSPAEGDLFYSNGTPRAEGLWYYKDADWQAVLGNDAVITRLTMDNLVLDPQASDPGTPDTGEIFYSDGTSRDAGLWVYNGVGWVAISRLKIQEFRYNQTKIVRAATTVNITVSTALNNGDILDGLTLATNDRVLVKNQTVTSENGVYIVGASPTRASDFDTAAEVTKGVVYVTAGTANANTMWFQNLTVVTLGADAQTWASSMSALTVTVPEGVFEAQVYGIGGGGGGAGGGGGTGNNSTAASPGGGGGGAGSFLTGPWPLKVTPGSTLTITLGQGGIGGAGVTNNGGGSGSSGGQGGASTVAGSTDGYTLSFTGGASGSGGFGFATGGGGGAGGISSVASYYANFQKVISGGAGGAWTGTQAGTAGSTGTASMFGSGGAGGAMSPSGAGTVGGSGGGGAAGYRGGTVAAGYTGEGGAGGVGWSSVISTEGSPGVGYGSGGGGGGGGSQATISGTSRNGQKGAPGGHGYVRIVW